MADRRFVSCEPIDKGWSIDKKYCLTDESGAKFLLRVTPLEKREAKRLEFKWMQRLSALSIPMCLPIEFGECKDGVYSIQSWIEGVDAEECLPKLPDAEQEAYGREAGQILRRIHSIAAPNAQEPWGSRFGRKIDNRLKAYEESPLHYEGGDAFIECIRQNRHLIEGRPQALQHGDYHIGNMMIDTEGRLQIIDFNRMDIGDPWEEFNRIVWCGQKAPRFARGMIDGYFGGDVPELFWRLMALYISNNTLGSIIWAIPFGQKEIDVMIQQAREVLTWYDGMRRLVPSWYTAAR